MTPTEAVQGMTRRTIEPLRLESQCNTVNVSEEENSISSTRNLPALASSFTIPQDAAASPAEIAKAFMNSRPPKAPSSAVSLHQQILPVDKSVSCLEPLAVKAPELEVATPSVLPSSDGRELSGAGYQTPKPRGRTAICRMSRSPYFKVDASSNLKWNMCTAAGNAGFPASPLTPGSSSNSDVYKALKRGSSVLYNDHGSFGPIRRLRQKFNVISASKDLQLIPATNLGGSLPKFDKDVLKGSASTQTLPPVNERKSSSAAVHFSENTDTKMLLSSFPSVPGQSSEAGMRSFDFEQFTHPEKKLDIKPISRDDSPSKLTANMLNGRALKSMENVKKSQFISMDANASLNIERGSQQLSDSLLKEHGQVLGNGPLKTDILGVKSLTSVNGVNKNSSLRIQNEDGAISFPAPISSPRKPSFQMTAPEEFLELDDEDDDVDMSVELDPSRGRTELPILKTSSSSIPTSSTSTVVPNSISFSECSKMDNDACYSLENNGSSQKVSVRTEPIYSSSVVSTSTFPTPSDDKLVPQAEHTTVPDFSFASRSTNSHLFSSATCVASESVDTKAAVDSLCSDPKVYLETSDVLGSDKSGTKGLEEPAGIFVSTATSTLDSIENVSYGGSITLSRSNGTLQSSSLSSFVSTSLPGVTATPVSSFSLNSTSAATTPSPPVSFTSALLSSSNVFGFLGGTSAVFPSLTALSSDKSNDVNSGGEGKQQFSSDVHISFSGSGSASSTVAVSSLSTVLAASSAPAASSIFSGASTSGSGFGAPPLLSSKTDGVVDFSSAQPVGSSISADTSSSQDSTTIIGATGVTVFGAQPPKSSSSCGSLFSQSSTINSVSFSSCPTSGLSNSSVLFGSSPSPSPFGLSSSSMPGFSNKPFATGNQSAISFGSASGLSFSASETSTVQNSQFLLPSITGASSSSSLFSFTTSSSNSSSGLSFLAGSCSSSSVLSFIPSSTSSSLAKSTFSLSDKSTMFNNSSLASTSSIPSTTFGSSPSTGFSFGLAATASGTSSFGFSSSTVSVFSFTSSGATNSLATSTPVFGGPSSAGALPSLSQNNDQMNVEDSMSDDTIQAPAPMVPTFGQSSIAPASQNFSFGSSFTSGGTPLFQFGSHQNPTAPQNSNPFQAGGSLEFAPGGSFSWGSGGVRPRSVILWLEPSGK
ncbi:hypothetical protein HPP92_018069 [Vanilla planifolia]|uniref:Nuclear pore complex protein NUP1-like n=1 Tax=Vanilla planifolia TaxID=51239 RepID=A0A835Q943_VANPL|nr:hypothetical protein HPP92_018069 [Vanilla planifolia]